MGSNVDILGLCGKSTAWERMPTYWSCEEIVRYGKECPQLQKKRVVDTRKTKQISYIEISNLRKRD